MYVCCKVKRAVTCRTRCNSKNPNLMLQLLAALQLCRNSGTLLKLRPITDESQFVVCAAICSQGLTKGVFRSGTTVGCARFLGAAQLLCVADQSQKFRDIICSPYKLEQRNLKTAGVTRPRLSKPTGFRVLGFGILLCQSNAWLRCLDLLVWGFGFLRSSESGVWAMDVFW